MSASSRADCAMPSVSRPVSLCKLYGRATARHAAVAAPIAESSASRRSHEWHASLARRWRQRDISSGRRYVDDERRAQRDFAMPSTRLHFNGTCHATRPPHHLPNLPAPRASLPPQHHFEQLQRGAHTAGPKYHCPFSRMPFLFSPRKRRFCHVAYDD